MPEVKDQIALVVGDAESLVTPMATLLPRFGYSVVTATDSRQLLACVRERRPDVCFVDLSFQSSGLGLTNIQAVCDALGATPVYVAITESSERDCVKRALSMGADDVMAKPVDRQILASKCMLYASPLSGRAAAQAVEPLLPVPPAGASADIHMDMEILEIDEDGLYLAVEHFIAKGALLRWQDQMSTDISGDSKPLLLTVTGSWVESDGRYGAYAELDGSNEATMRALRNWLAIQAARKS